MSTENRDPLDNTTVDDPSFALNSNVNVNVDDFELERTIVRQRQTAIYNQILRDAANSNSSSGAAAVPPAAAAAAAPVESAPPAAAAAAAAEAPSEFNCPPHNIYIMSSFTCQRPDLMQTITTYLRTLEGHHIEPAVARAAARAAVAVIIAARTDPDARAAIDRAEAEYQALLADVAAAAAELPEVPAAAAAVAPEPSEPPAAAAAAPTGKKRKRPTEEAKGQHKETRKNKTVRIEEKESEYEWVYDSDFEGPFRVIKLQKKAEETE